MPDPFNPLDKINLGKSVVDALLASDPHPLHNIQPFNGSGVYAIYYAGPFAPYQPIAKDGGPPIYVGKAVPSGSRRGSSLTVTTTGRGLFSRIAEHRESVRSAINLNVEDFSVRYLVVDDIWIPLGETLLIAAFNPLWNSVLDGFGNHDPGAGRYGGLRPLWDVFHPGRAWAERCKERLETQGEISRRIADFFKQQIQGSD